LVGFLWISAEIPLETSQIALDDDVVLEGWCGLVSLKVRAIIGEVSG